ncbi:MAG: hypothetical protein ACQEQO_05165 [Thermodesulfobacteriota bacterium]
MGFLGMVKIAGFFKGLNGIVRLIVFHNNKHEDICHNMIISLFEEKTIMPEGSNVLE